jgi:WD40 repeat protein/tRNA A-37 threonylcarbamoyl transferase component Bud32
MNTMHACPNGHQWDAAGEQSRCPICGAQPSEAAAARARAGDAETVTHAPADSSQPDERIEDAMLSYLKAKEVGWPPDHEAFLRRYPGLTAELEGFLADEERIAPALAPLRALGARAAIAPPTEPLGDYEVLDQIAHGGMGVVYRARQKRPGRIVALKMILAGAHASQVDRERFRTEAQAMARLQHPNIVQVFEVGEHKGQPYFSMEFCPGGSLAKKLAGTPLPPKEAGELIETLARAMHAAHAKGVIHRDLKPANVLLAEDGTPKVTDFGLARKIDEPGMTMTGAIMGTPSYMAPEQAQGKVKELGRACDVYALGAIFYECMTGRPPFRAATKLETMMQVISDEPVPPRQLNAGVPKDLETVCLKCLHKEPRKRYPSAAALADDLRRFRAGEPIVARPISAVERGVKWARRRPATAGLIVAIFLGVLGFVGAGLWYIDRLEEFNSDLADAAQREKTKADEAEEAKRQAETNSEQEKIAWQQEKTAREKAERAQAEITTMLAQSRWNEGLTFIAAGLLDQVPAAHRRGSWSYLKRQFEGSYATLYGHSKAAARVNFSPDGALLATTGYDGAVRIWEVATGREIRTLPGANLVAFTPDGRHLAMLNPNGVSFCDPRTGREERSITVPGGFSSTMAFSIDGALLALWGGRSVTIVNARSGAMVRHFQNPFGHHDFSVSRFSRGVAFSPDGKLVACADGPNDAVGGLIGDGPQKPGLVWNIHGGSALMPRAMLIHSGAVHCVAFSPDGRWLASGGSDNLVKLWHPPTAEEVRSFSVKVDDRGKLVPEHSSTAKEVRSFAVPGVRNVAFSPDGQLLATGASDGAIQLWDVASGQEVRALRGHDPLGNSVGSGVTSLAFSPDGMLLASAGADNTIKLWDARPRPDVGTLSVPAFGLAFSPDGGRLATTDAGATVKLWDLRTRQIIQSLRGHAGAGDVACSGNGVVATASADSVKLWDLDSGQELRTLAGRFRVSLSGDGSRLATVGDDKTLKLWDTRSGQELRRLSHPYGVVAIALSEDGALVAAVSLFRKTNVWESARIKLWESSSGRELHSLVLSDRENFWDHLPRSLALSPDGTLLAAATGISVKLWDTKTGKEIHLLRGHTSGVTSVAFSADGLLASGDHSGMIKLWEPRTGTQLQTFHGHTKKWQCSVHRLAFNRDGLLASASQDRTIKLWDTRTKPLARPGPPSEAEKTFRQAMAQPDLYWHNEQFQQHDKAGNRFAAAFHLHRLAEIRGNDSNSWDRLVGSVAPLARENRDLFHLIYRELQQRSAVRLHRQLQPQLAAAAAALTVAPAPATVAGLQAEIDALAADCQAVARLGALASDGVADSKHLLAVAGLAVQLDPQSAGAHEALGAALLRQGNAAAAVKELTQAVQRCGEAGPTVGTCVFLAMAHQRLGQTEQVKEWLDRADELAKNADATQLAVFGLLKSTALAAPRASPLLTIQEKLTAADPLDTFALTQKSYAKVHQVPFEVGKAYLINLEGTFDTFLRIEDADKKPLLFNDDVWPPGNLNSRLVFLPAKKDTYRMVVTSFRPQDTGAYTLTVREAAKVGDAMTINDKLEKAEPVPKGGRFSKLHKIELTGRSPYTLELASADFDGRLVLLDGSGKQGLAQASPGTANGSPARLDITPEADGVLHVFVTSGQAGQTGAYTLTVQRFEEVRKAKHQ